MKRNIFILIFIVFTLVIGFYFWNGSKIKTSIVQKNNKKGCTLEAKLCPDGSSVGRAGPNCEFDPCPGEKEGILISSPKNNEKVKNPFKIEGQAKGFWFFESEFTAELYDTNNNSLGRAILTAKGNWMTENFVPFEGKLNFSKPSTSSGILRFLNSNPSGISEQQRIFEIPVQFEDISYRKILLYYYNQEKDKDEKGNIRCSRDGLVAIEREIPVSKTPIQDTINLLLKGKENLTQNDIERGITTEYPLEGLRLKSANLKEDGTLILEFEDPLNRTGGGSCRVGILWSQIEETAKQFPEVKKVRFLPEALFQP